jgi:hypothetical protein
MSGSTLYPEKQRQRLPLPLSCRVVAFNAVVSVAVVMTARLIDGVTGEQA